MWSNATPGCLHTQRCCCGHTGTNFLIRANAFQECGWSPTWTLTEDFALGMELKQRGWQVHPCLPLTQRGLRPACIAPSALSAVQMGWWESMAGHLLALSLAVFLCGTSCLDGHDSVHHLACSLTTGLAVFGLGQESVETLCNTFVDCLPLCLNRRTLQLLQSKEVLYQWQCMHMHSTAHVLFKATVLLLSLYLCSLLAAVPIPEGVPGHWRSSRASA